MQKGKFIYKSKIKEYKCNGLDVELEYLYLDLDSKEGKVILEFAEQYIKENWDSQTKNELIDDRFFTDADEKDVDILDIWEYKGDFIMELNVFRKGKLNLRLEI